MHAPLKQHDEHRADQIAGRSIILFKILWRKGISPEMRVVFEGQGYRIEDVEEIDRRAGLVLTCSAFEFVPGGSG